MILRPLSRTLFLTAKCRLAFAARATTQNHKHSTKQTPRSPQQHLILSSFDALTQSVVKDYKGLLSQINNADSIVSTQLTEESNNLNELNEELCKVWDQYLSEGWKIEFKQKQLVQFEKALPQSIHVRFVIDNASRQSKSNAQSDGQDDQQRQVQAKIQQIRDMFSRGAGHKTSSKSNEDEEDQSQQEDYHERKGRNIKRARKQRNQSNQSQSSPNVQTPQEIDASQIQQDITLQTEEKNIQTVSVYIYISKPHTQNTFCSKFKLTCTQQAHYQQKQVTLTIADAGFLPNQTAKDILSFNQADPFEYRVADGLARNNSSDVFFVEEISKQIGKGMSKGIAETVSDMNIIARETHSIKVMQQTMQKRLHWLKAVHEFI